ncbi:hypothetical protein GCM10017744_028280 [Streptomyces antimycoticus]|uniref:Histidine kinase/HSP90-like ATPase domain-containing protein n=2 Tax=Streptomyces antimycoticus TaxID=68175 RepID=A0A4D4KKX8_9ACTN|nr:hypothetical protein SANT12839_074050 [Streptomyces antimycoticus]
MSWSRSILETIRRDLHDRNPFRYRNTPAKRRTHYTHCAEKCQQPPYARGAAVTQMRDGSQVLIWHWNDRTHSVATRIRVALRCALRELEIPEQAASDAAMAAWELTANALEHAHGPYEMRLLRKGPSFVFEIEDSDPLLPALPSFRNGGVEADTELPERGRGLQIVEAFARGRWGFRLSESETKVAWMAISTASED